MDNFTLTITLVTAACIVLFGVVAVAGALYGIFVGYPRYRQNRVAELKATGRQGLATILEAEAGFRPPHVRKAVFIRTPVRLEIRVPGIEPYEVHKTFNVPAHAIAQLIPGKVVAVWVDPNQPRNLDKIVIDL